MKYLLLYSLTTGLVVGHAITPSDEGLPDAASDHAYIEASPDDWEYVHGLDLTGVEPGLFFSAEKQRTDPQKRSGSAPDIVRENGLYQVSRREAYDPLPEQLDRITKALSALAAAGIDIGEAGIEQISHCQAVKSRYPKRVL